MKRGHLFFAILFLISCQAQITQVEIQEKSKSAFLSSIQLDGKELNGFRSDLYEYTIYRSAEQSSNIVEVAYQAADGGAKIFVNGTKMELELNKSNLFYLTVISEDGTVSNVYTINIFYYNNNCAGLKALRINGNWINGFFPDCAVYSVDCFVDEFIITADPVVAGTGITVADETNADVVLGTPVQWNGSAVKKFTITVRNGVTTETYTVTVVHASTDAFCYFNDLSAQFATDGFTTVIAGDSLSVGYGFFGSGFSNSWNTYPGILSWGHMVRDAIHRNDPAFFHADELLASGKITNASSGVVGESANVVKWWSDGRKSSSSSYFMPFNNRNVAFFLDTLSDTSNDITITYDVPRDKAVLYFAKSPRNSIASQFKIRVNDATADVQVRISDMRTRSVTSTYVNLEGDLSYYQGYEPVAVEIENLNPGENRITLTGFKSVGNGSKCGFFFLGVGSKYAPVYLTGRSGATSDFYTDTEVASGAFQQRLCVPDASGNRSAPDCLIWIVGANDSSNNNGMGHNGTNDQGKAIGKVDAAAYKANLQKVVKRLREMNPNIQILLLASPVWSTASTPDPTYNAQRTLLLRYAEAMKECALEYSCMFIHTVRMLDYIPTNTPAVSSGAEIQWRMDSIHFSHFGHTFMARNILRNLMPEGNYSRDMIDAGEVYHEGRSSL